MGTTKIKHILCVDDDPATLRVRKLILEASGYSVVTVGSGPEALDLLADGTRVDLVLLDYLMHSMNGDELAEELRARYPSLPLIAVSAVGQLPANLVNAVDRHVQKGQHPEVLLSIVSEVLSRPSTPPSPKLNSPKTVLCVDDEQLELQFRRMLLESAGFIVLQAQSAGAAMEVFLSQPVDAVVMDYWLSGKNGTAVAEEMKRLRPKTPIVILSGFSSLPGEGLLVDAWLRKAEVEPEELVNEVRRLVGLRPQTPPSPE